MVADASAALPSGAVPALRVAFLLEDALGHATHAQLLRQAPAREPLLRIELQ